MPPGQIGLEGFILALEELRKVAASNDEPLPKRRNAIRSLVMARDEAALPILQKLVTQRDLAAEVVRGLAAFDQPDSADLIIQGYNRMYLRERPIAIATLCSRPEFALKLLNAVSEGWLPKDDVTPFFIRQLRAFDNDEITAKLEAVWPQWRHTSKDKLAKVEEYKKLLSDDRIAGANASNGRALFNKNCAACHKLFGQGGEVAPDLTGAQRHNLMYLLENIVDPSAQVAEKYRMSIISLVDGRVVSGVVLRENEETVTVQTPTEIINLPQKDVDVRRNTNLSMMPERQLDEMSEQEVADLVAYLMSPTQVD